MRYSSLTQVPSSRTGYNAHGFPPNTTILVHSFYLDWQIEQRGKVTSGGPKRDFVSSVIELTEPMAAQQKYSYVPVNDHHGWFAWRDQQHRYNLQQYKQLPERREGIFGRVSCLSQLHVEKELSIHK